jgi:hypothetical protein
MLLVDPLLLLLLLLLPLSCRCCCCCLLYSNGILYWTPKLVQALLLAAGHTGLAAIAAAAPPPPPPPQAAVPAAVQTSGTISYLRNSNSTVSSGGLWDTSQGNATTVVGSIGPADLSMTAHSAVTAAAAAAPGSAIVLLSAIPYAAASLFHLANAWHSQKHSERRLHITLTWLLGAVALLLLPFAATGGLAAAEGSSGGGGGTAAAVSISAAASVAAFVLLTVAHVGVNGANGLQTGLVAGAIQPADKALGLATYNTIGCIGSFFGPLVIGVIHDATGGYAVAMWVLGGSLAAAAGMVFCFRPDR